MLAFSGAFCDGLSLESVIAIRPLILVAHQLGLSFFHSFCLLKSFQVTVPSFCSTLSFSIPIFRIYIIFSLEFTTLLAT